MKPLLIALCLFSVMACKSKKNATKDKPSGTPTIMIGEFGSLATHSDEIKITKASIKDNVLTIHVSYLGSCADHGFKLIGSEMISKSLPPLRSIKLIHYKNGENCDKEIVQALEFDISNFAYKQEPGSEIILNLNGFDERLSYIFK